MTTPMLMTQHLTEETLAAYVDDRLDSDTRQPVTDHLASCGECREIVLMTAAFHSEEQSAKVVRGNFGGGWGMAAIGLAAAAMIVLLVQPGSLFVKDQFDKILKIPGRGWDWTMNVLHPAPDVDDLVAASQNARERPSAGRLAGEFAYSAEPTTMRGGAEEDEDYGAKAKLLQIRSELEETKRDLHVLGVARLLTAEKGKKDVNDAVVALEMAYQQARGKERDAIAIDLAATLIAYARWSGNDKNDHGRALELSNDVLTRQPKSPEALWNRAIALQSLGRDNEAMRAWDDYLKVDPSSRWADEATTKHKARLQIGP